jgi:hypothetical protein
MSSHLLISEMGENAQHGNHTPASGVVSVAKSGFDLSVLELERDLI